ncbi:hypothetical protein LY78DRAFT_660024 [Colletotrichum sublineola]|nr:hypothetical protein LY78DRAFT_660024 [Colletotrichum sublineola]
MGQPPSIRLTVYVGMVVAFIFGIKTSIRLSETLREGAWWGHRGGRRRISWPSLPFPLLSFPAVRGSTMHRHRCWGPASSALSVTGSTLITSVVPSGARQTPLPESRTIPGRKGVVAGAGEEASPLPVVKSDGERR